MLCKLGQGALERFTMEAHVNGVFVYMVIKLNVKLTAYLVCRVALKLYGAKMGSLGLPKLQMHDLVKSAHGMT